MFLLLQALNLRGCSRVSGACLQHLSSLSKVTDLCLLHNPQLAVDDACVASLAKLPSLKILGLGNYQVRWGMYRSCCCWQCLAIATPTNAQGGGS